MPAFFLRKALSLYASRLLGPCLRLFFLIFLAQPGAFGSFAVFQALLRPFFLQYTWIVPLFGAKTVAK